MALTLDLEALQVKRNEIAILDEKLNAASDSEAAGKIAFTNQLVKDHENIWKPVSDQLIAAFENDIVNEETGETTPALATSPEALAASYNGIVRALREKFKKNIDDFITAKVDENKSETEEAAKVSQEEYDAWMAERREATKQFRALKEAMDLFGMDVSSVPDPPKRTGAPRGARRKTAFTSYQFYVDGKARSETSNSLSSIAASVCADLDWRVQNLHDYLSEKGIDLQNPPESFEVTLPNDKVLRGERKAASVSDEEEDETEEEETLEEE